MRPADSGHRRRILFVEANEDGTVGGSHRALLDLVRGLDRRRFDPVVLFYQDSAAVREVEDAEVHVWDEIRRHELQFHGPVGLLRNLRGVAPSVWRRMRFLRRARIDLVHLNNAPALGYEDWLPAAWLCRVPCIAHVRGVFWTARRRAARLVMGLFDRMPPVSRWLADFTRDAGVSPDRICVVPDGIDTSRFLGRVHRPPADVRAELEVPDDALLVLMVGHLRRWKGHRVVLEALAQVEEAARRRMRVVFAGTVSPSERGYADELRALAHESKLEPFVQFLGARDDVPDLMHAADVLVHASTSPEPFGLVLLEAMVLGVPVVASALGGPLEILTPESGMTFDPAAPAELAACLERLARDPSLRRQLGEAGRARAESFRIERTIERVQAVYEALLG